MTSVALVGTGSFARAHLDALRAVPGAEIRYVVGSDAQRTAEVARLAGATPLTDLGVALEDPTLDAVDVCNRTPRHAPDSLRALRAGKHVHVDKPAALSVADFDEMVDAAEESKVTLAVGQTVRFQSTVAATHEAIVAGQIGQPRLLHISWYTGHVWPAAWRGWQLDRSASGGHPVHNGVHIIDAATWLLGSPIIEVMAREFRTSSPELPIPDSFTITARAANGALATLELCYGLRTPGRSIRRLMIAGHEGTLLHDSEHDPGLESAAHLPGPASVEGALDAQMAEWIASVRGASFRVKNGEVRSTLAAALATQQSLDERRSVAVSENIAGGAR